VRKDLKRGGGLLGTWEKTYGSERKKAAGDKSWGSSKKKSNMKKWIAQGDIFRRPEGTKGKNDMKKAAQGKKKKKRGGGWEKQRHSPERGGD